MHHDVWRDGTAADDTSADPPYGCEPSICLQSKRIVAAVAQTEKIDAFRLTDTPIINTGLRALKILMVSGAWPPERCGVADYTATLSAALAVENLDVIPFKPKTRLLDFNAVLAQIKQIDPHIVHIQYPSEGYGRSINPLLLPLVSQRPCVVTLHEYGIYRVRQPRFFPFSFATALIFTNEVEFRRFKAEIRLTPSRTCIIPIGSNIPVGPDAVLRVPRSVCYFGLILPGKGIEKYLQLARLLQGHPFSFALIGAFQDRYRTFAQDITRELESLGATVHLQRSPDDVAQLLKATTYAYLPFLDGASEKRGSLLAALVNGVRILTPHGAATSEALRQVTLDAQDPEAAASTLLALESTGQTSYTDIDSDADQAIRQRFNWTNIARSYRQIYDDVLR
jgi:glycosyltransferase involved in cell wall biosynthesis